MSIQLILKTIFIPTHSESSSAEQFTIALLSYYPRQSILVFEETSKSYMTLYLHVILRKMSLSPSWSDSPYSVQMEAGPPPRAAQGLSPYGKLAPESRLPYARS